MGTHAQNKNRNQMSFPRPQICRPGQDWLPIWVLLKRRKKKSYTNISSYSYHTSSRSRSRYSSYSYTLQKQLQLPETETTATHQKQLHTTRNRTHARTQTTQLHLHDLKPDTNQLITHDHENRTLRPKHTTGHNRRLKHNQLHTTITHTQAPETEHDHENRRAGSRTSYARSCEQN